jgi:S-adenosylmethionine-diacylglycerol 3-amino-3-carboxypropyl transferase
MQPLRWRPLYSACNEDTCSELRALEIDGEDIVVAIAAGGGRALSLLTAGPRRLVAVDRRLDQVFQLELKAVALDGLGYDDFVGFLGLVDGMNRLEMYGALRPSLSPSARRYWDRRRGLVRSGVLYAGRCEATLARIAWLLSRLDRFTWGLRYFEFDNMEDQLAALKRDRDRFRDGMSWWRFYVHPVVAYAVTQDPGFLGCTGESNWDYLRARMIGYLSRNLARESFLLHMACFGRYPPAGPLPPYLTRIGFERARKYIERLELLHGLVEDVPGRVHLSGRVKWSLSDVGGWMSEAAFHDLVRAVTRVGAPGSRLCARNFVARRSLPADPLLHSRRLDALCDELDRTDSSVFFRFDVTEYRGMEST